MKILQLVTKRQYRGAEVFAANLSAELLKFGHQIIFAGLYRNTSNILEVEGANNIDLVKNKAGLLSSNLVKAIVKLINEEQPDVVQCNGSDTLKYMVAASYFTKKIPITYRNISTISEWIDNPLKLAIYKYLFKKVAFVTSVGSGSIQDLIETLNYPEKQTSVIRRGIPIKTVNLSLAETSFKTKLNLDVSDRIVMHIGNFSPEKNHTFLLEIFVEIKKESPGIKLVCVGNGVTFESIKKQIKKLNLDDTVFLLGFRKDIPELLSQADCFALCSKIEGVPGVILEAASQKVPSVATNVGGVKEVLINGKTGFIVDNFNKNEFKERIISLVNDDALNRQMGESAYKLIKNEFNPVKNARKFESLYSSLIGKPKRGNKKLRILQIIQKKQFRGAEVFASQLGTHFKNSEHEVKIISIYDGNARLPFEGEIISLNRNKWSRSFDPSGWRKLSVLINSFKPDVVQANASDTLKYAVMSKCIFGWKAPLVYRNASTPSFYIKNETTRRFNAFLLNQVDLVASVSQASLRDLNTLFPFTIGKSLVIPVGVEEKSDLKTSDYNFQFKNKETFNLLHIGSFTHEKNHLGLLRIFKEISAKEEVFHLNLLGAGPLLNDIKTKVKEFGLESKVSFWGEVEDTQDYIRSADVLLLPSLVEGLPGVILESMYYKTPVIAYSVGGVSEIIINNETGKLVDFDDEEGFIKAIFEIKINQVLAKLMIENAFALVSNNFMNKQIKDSFLDSYRNLTKLI
ncbi:MAG: glycosyltransferase family 4 protein [Salegentibacter mishustinae]|nr:glycosyltransferase family 4 protein [Salegentibacter mishustinae]